MTFNRKDLCSHESNFLKFSHFIAFVLVQKAIIIEGENEGTSRFNKSLNIAIPCEKFSFCFYANKCRQQRGQQEVTVAVQI